MLPNRTNPEAHRSALLAELEARRPRAIVVGGSAGGMEALRVLLPALAADFPVPVLIVLHVAVESSTAWSGALFRAALEVREAEDKLLTKAGTAYIAPPDYHLLVERSGLLSLSVEAPVNHARPAIDVLFESAAWAYSHELLGIVLSGANADGAAGLAAIRRANGLCWIQAPEQALATSMPQAARQAVPDAHVLSLPEMAEVLHAFH